MKRNLLVILLAVSGLMTSEVMAEVEVSTKGGLKVTSGDFSMEFGGRIQYDYNRSEKNGKVDEDDFDLRRGRVYFQGNVSKDWQYKINFNVDGTGAEDLYLRYKGWETPL